MNALAAWNASPTPAAQAALLSCCGSPAWARTLVERRPYPTPAALLRDAEAVWFALPEADWLIAFACHPRIGEHHADKPTTPAFSQSSASEQAASYATLDGIASAFAAANRLYEERFGFLFLVFANGRTAPELLAILEERLGNDQPSEFLEAGRQQWLITHLRLTRWLA